MNFYVSPCHVSLMESVCTHLQSSCIILCVAPTLHFIQKWDAQDKNGHILFESYMLR